MTSNQPKNQKQAKPLTSLERSQNTSQFNGRAHPGQPCLTQSCCLIRTQLSDETLVALRLEEKFPKCSTPAPLKRLWDSTDSSQGLSGPAFPTPEDRAESIGEKASVISQ